MKKVGLALGGGVAHGLAHVGVLLALERAGVPIDCVAGTSAGALIGAFWAAGWPAEQIHHEALNLGWRHLARPAWPGRGGLISFYRLECYLIRKLGDLTFADLPRCFAAVATDLLSGESVAVTSGRVAAAVHASAAVPGVVVPVEIDGRLLGDGGVSNNLPVTVARALGAEYVIGVSVLGLHLRRARGALGRGLAAIESAVRWAGGGLRLADCLVEPDIAGYSYIRFRHRHELIALGQAAAEARLPEIKAALGLDSPLNGEDLAGITDPSEPEPVIY